MTRILLEPDAQVQPGQQWLVLEDSDWARSLIKALTGRSMFSLQVEIGRVRKEPGVIKLAHTADVDEGIVQLINELADVRFQSPTMVQLTMTETAEGLE